MKLITSAAYIGPDFMTEIGRLPPAFLPIGNRRVFEHQVQALGTDDLYLSVPEGYQLSEHDSRYLKERGVQVLVVPAGLTLGASVAYCWNCAPGDHKKLEILHGDTLLLDFPYGELDAVSESKNAGYYPRARLMPDEAEAEAGQAWAGDDEWVLSGYFAFSDPRLLIRKIVEQRGNFIRGMYLYAEERPLRGLREGTWLDLGHINTYFRSRSVMTTERSFNRMAIASRVVTKGGEWNAKIEAEAAWFQRLPAELRIYLPQFLHDRSDSAQPEYAIEYMHLLPMSDLYVHGQLPGPAWRHIFRSCHEVLTAFQDASVEADVDLERLDALYLPKTNSRLADFAKSGFDIDRPLRFEGVATPSLKEIARHSAEFISPATVNDVGIVHGDFCFSNILHDGRVQSVRLIDPRGLDTEERLTLYGDTRYDIAKLYHSVIGMYDFVIAGRCAHTVDDDDYSLSFEGGEYLASIQSAFREVFFDDASLSERGVLAANIHLFISMLPLHADRPETQSALLANALRLYQQLLSLEVTP